jgi:hypothetical protein
VLHRVTSDSARDVALLHRPSTVKQPTLRVCSSFEHPFGHQLLHDAGRLLRPECRPELGPFLPCDQAQFCVLIKNHTRDDPFFIIGAAFRQFPGREIDDFGQTDFQKQVVRKLRIQWSRAVRDVDPAAVA